MARIQPVNHEAAEGKTKELLDAVQAKMGGVPNLLSTLAQGPAALESYLSLSGALAGSTLSAGLREQIALAVAGANNCAYCASAHTFLAKNAGVNEAERETNLRGESADPKTQAALTFARRVVAERGWIDDSALAEVRDAGFADGEVLEIVATVVLNIFTNYVNHIAETEIDFPVVAVPETAGV